MLHKKQTRYKTYFLIKNKTKQVSSRGFSVRKGVWHACEPHACITSLAPTAGERLDRCKLLLLPPQMQTVAITVLKAGTQSKGARISKQFSRVCDCSLSLTCVYILHAYIIYLFICLIYLCLIDIYLELFEHTCIQPRAIVAPQILIQRNIEEIIQSPSPGIQLHSCVILGVFFIIVFSLLKQFQFRINSSLDWLVTYSPPLQVISNRCNANLMANNVKLKKVLH